MAFVGLGGSLNVGGGRRPGVCRAGLARARMAAATTGGAANVQNRSWHGQDKFNVSSLFVTDVVNTEDANGDRAETPTHGAEGFMLTADPTTRTSIKRVMRRPAPSLIDEDGHSVQLGGPVLGLFELDTKEGNGAHKSRVLGSLISARNMVSVNDETPLFFHFVGSLRLELVHTLPSVGECRQALVRPFFDNPHGISEEMDCKLCLLFCDLLDEISEAELLSEGHISDETKFYLDLVLPLRGHMTASPTRASRLTRLQRECMCFYISNLLSLKEGQRRALFYSTDGKSRVELAIAALQQRRRNERLDPEPWVGRMAAPS